MRVLLTHNRDLLKHFYGNKAVEQLKALPIELIMNDSDEPLRGEALVKAAEGCEVVISDRLAAGPREVMSRLKDVKTFIRCAVDIRNIDVDAASDANILICRCSSGYADSVGEHAIALMLDLARGITRDAERYHAGEATHPMVFRKQLAGAHVGVIGYGSIGKRIVELALAFAMKVSVYDPYAKVGHGAVDVVGPRRGAVAAGLRHLRRLCDAGDHPHDECERLREDAQGRLFHQHLPRPPRQ